MLAEAIGDSILLYFQQQEGVGRKGRKEGRKDEEGEKKDRNKVRRRQRLPGLSRA